MADGNSPTLKVLITPQFDENGLAISLFISLTIDSPPILRDSKFLTFPATFSGVRTEHELKDSDESGELPLIFKDPEESNQSPERSWVTLRNTFGDVEIQYEVSTSSKDQFKTGGPVLGLYSEQGGLLGSGFAIVPVFSSKTSYQNVVEWDLKQAPKGTRAVWTYGEGPHPVERVGPASILRDSVYMVGRIQSNPPATRTITRALDNYGYYWFGSLPPNIEVIKDMHRTFFNNAKNFFETDDHTKEDFDHPFFASVPKGNYKYIAEPPPHRSFVRNTGNTKSFGGTSFGHSHIFNYDDQIGKVHKFDLIRRMIYEMTDIWLGPSVEEGIDWLYEGIKECLTFYMPFRNQGPGNYFQSTITMLCTKYYTSPLINLPFEDVMKLADTDAYAREHIKARAWTFVFGVNLRVRQIAEDKLKTTRPIKDTDLMPLVGNKPRGKVLGIKQWIELLTPLVGVDIQTRYKEFCNGTIILLPETLYGTKAHYLKQVDDAILDFGVDRESFTEGLMKGLRVGTRAEIGHLRSGEKILWSSHEWRCVDDSDATMEVVVERNGAPRRLKYLPRTFEATKSWEMRTRDEEEIRAYEKFLREEEKKAKQGMVKVKLMTRSSKER
ncbi:hypothetical protein IFR05_002057 [Cadophora sp. M221]|nr:hypothetical protein IFR05_002057 [Cadophora sp. M221]